MSDDSEETFLQGLQISAIPTDRYRVFHVEVDLPASMPVNKMVEYLSETKTALQKMFPQHTRLIVSKKGQVTIKGE